MTWPWPWPQRRARPWPQRRARRPRPSPDAVQPAVPLTVTIRRTSLTVAILVIVVALLGPILLLTQWGFSQRSSSVYTPVADTTSRLVIAMRWAQSDLRIDRAYSLPGAPERLAERKQEAEAAIDELSTVAGDDPVFSDSIDTVAAATNAWLDYADSVVGTAGPTPGTGSGPTVNPESLNARAAFDEFITTSDELHALADEQRSRIRLWRTLILLLGSALAVSVILVITYGIYRNTRRAGELIVDPIEDLDRVARAETERSSGARARTDRGPAEVQELAKAFNRLLDTRDEFESGREEHVRRLEALDRQKDDFLSTVSHELRTPLASIIGYTEMLADGDSGELAPEQARLVTVIERNANRLRGLIEDLLILSRIEARELECEFAPMRLDRIVADVIESLRPVAARAQLTVVSDLAEVQMQGDALHLERAVTNLLGNAIKFTPAGGRATVTLTTSAASDGVPATATVSVSDTGIGIPADELKHLGTRFFRASTAQRATIPGTGLGVSIVRAIAESHGGSLTFDSVEGEGTTFRIALPLDPQGDGRPTSRRPSTDP